MANASTGWKCTHSASVISQTNTTATIRVTGYWTNDGWQYDINYVSAWAYCNGDKQLIKDSGSVNSQGDNYKSVSLGYHDYVINKTTAKQNITCKAQITSESSYVSGSKYSTEATVSISAKPSYTITYNANGGSGAPGNQTKWYGTNLTLSSTKPSRTGHTFAGWATSSTGSVVYQPGATYTNNSAVTLYAIWTANTYTVTYNANGGTGAPGNQTKTYGVNLTLSSTKPTRTNYNFLGWSTSANGGVVYKSGATYTNNSAVTLYAVWELAYTQPRINNFRAQRCTENGTASETGTYVKVTFDWATDYELIDIWIDWTTDHNFSTYSNKQVVTSGTSGSVSQIIGDGGISTETSYYIRSYVSDGGGSSHSVVVPIGTIKFPIDVKKGGTGVAIGKVAEKDDLFDIGMNTNILKTLSIGDENTRKLTVGGSTDYAWIDIRDTNNVMKNNIVLYDDRLYSKKIEAQNILSYRGWFNDLGGDLDGVIHQNGFYTYSGENTNKPVYFSGWGTLVNFGTSLYEQQLAIGNFTVDGCDLAVRSYVEGQGFTGWRYVGGVKKVLYDNTSGTNGTVTLSETAANFSYIDIYYAKGTDGTQYKHERVLNPNGKTVSLITGYWSSNELILLYQKTVTISGTSITVGGHGRLAIDGSGGNTISNSTNYISIYKVVGHK